MHDGRSLTPQQISDELGMGQVPLREDIRRAKAANPGASGGEYMTPTRDLTTAPGVPASMRRVLDMRCGSCGHEWVAPAVGNCPRCRSHFTEALSERTCLLSRS